MPQKAWQLVQIDLNFQTREIATQPSEFRTLARLGATEWLDMNPFTPMAEDPSIV